MANVLLVDDDGNVLLTLAIALRRRGHNVTMVADGPKAIDLLQRQQFHFLISDVRMPGMNGFELARQVRHLPHSPRVILTSAYSSLGTPDSSIEAFLQKPVDIVHLDALLRSAPPADATRESRDGRDGRDGKNRDGGAPSPLRPAFSTGP